MKKRFPAIILALALCVGLAIPAFAADGADPYTFEVRLANGSSAAQGTASYQLRDVAASSSTLTYSGTAASRSVTAPSLPLWTDIIVGGMETVGNLMLEEPVLRAWSDPDGDGIYEARVFQRVGNDVSVVPLTEKGPFTSASGTTYTDYITAQKAGFTAVNRGTGISWATLTTDRLNELFGPNTLLSVSVSVSGQYDKAKATQWFLLTGAPYFTDVTNSSQYYYAPVKWALSEGITQGTTTTTFSPSDSCTHVQILTFLWRAADEPAASTAAPITVADAYTGAVNWAYEKGMIDASFNPSAPCTRADAAVYIYQANGCPPSKASSFTDVAPDAPYAAAVSWAAATGITGGTTTTTFTPDRVCNRGEIVTFLQRTYVEETRLPV